MEMDVCSKVSCNLIYKLWALSKWEILTFNHTTIIRPVYVIFVNAKMSFHVLRQPTSFLLPRQCHGVEWNICGTQWIEKWHLKKCQSVFPETASSYSEYSTEIGVSNFQWNYYRWSSSEWGDTGTLFMERNTAVEFWNCNFLIIWKATDVFHPYCIRVAAEIADQYLTTWTN